MHEMYTKLKPFVMAGKNRTGIAFNKDFASTPSTLVEQWEKQLAQNVQGTDDCNFDLPIYFNEAGFGSAFQNVANVVMLALHGNLTFGFCLDGRSESIWNPYFKMPFKTCSSCPKAVAGNGDVTDLVKENVRHLSNMWQVLARSWLQIISCINVAFFDFFKVCLFYCPLYHSV
jgi:hypothetical protein